MNYGINKVMIMGHLGHDPELKYYSKKKATALISVTTNEAMTDKRTGEQKIVTQRHWVYFFGHLAKVVNDLLHEGCYVYVEGYLSSRSWQDDEGQKHTAIRIVGRQLQLLSSARQNTDKNEICN